MIIKRGERIELHVVYHTTFPHLYVFSSFEMLNLHLQQHVFRMLGMLLFVYNGNYWVFLFFLKIVSVTERPVTQTKAIATHRLKTSVLVISEVTLS